MYTLWSICKDRYFSGDRSMKEQTASLTAGTRTSLADTVAHTLAEQHPSAEDDGAVDVSSMEEELRQIEEELLAAEERLAQAKEKEDFVSKRIKKYQQLLQQQDVIEDEEEYSEQGSPERTSEQEAHHQQQLAKQQHLKETLGSVIDVHLTMMKNIKLMTREVAELEQKKYHLRKMTKECRDFLVMAEEAERPTQLYHDDGDDEVHAMEAGAMELALLSNNDDAGTTVDNVEDEPKEESRQDSYNASENGVGMIDKIPSQSDNRIPSHDVDVDDANAPQPPKISASDGAEDQVEDPVSDLTEKTVN